MGFEIATPVCPLARNDTVVDQPCRVGDGDHTVPFSRAENITQNVGLTACSRR